MAEAGEIEAHVETAREQLIDAEIGLRERRYHLSFLSSALSAENASSALILALGAKVSKKHQNWMVLVNLAPQLDKGARANVEDISSKLHELEPHIPRLLRYPFRYKEGWQIPPKYYTLEMAKKALAIAKAILELVTRCLERLKQIKL